MRTTRKHVHSCHGLPSTAALVEQATKPLRCTAFNFVKEPPRKVVYSVSQVPPYAALSSSLTQPAIATHAQHVSVGHRKHAGSGGCCCLCSSVHAAIWHDAPLQTERAHLHSRYPQRTQPRPPTASGWQPWPTCPSSSETERCSAKRLLEVANPAQPINQH